jgi:hypothetical protein
MSTLRKWFMKCGVCAVAATVVVACTAGEAPPSTGTYTVQFPSTAAAVATDAVQIFIFDVPEQDRAVICQNLIQARKRREPLKPVVTNPQVNICELMKGAKPISVPYGEKAALAVTIRKGVDFMIGCMVQTFGDGDAPLAIPVSLIDVGQGVPDTQCKNVSEFCGKVCTAN